MKITIPLIMKYINTLFLFLFLFICNVAYGQSENLNKIMHKADSLYKAQQYPQALDYYVKGLKIAEAEKQYTPYLIFIGYISNIYEEYKDYYSALEYHKKGYKIAVENKKQNLESCYLINMVNCLCKIGDVDQAKKYFALQKKTPTTIYKEEWQYYVLYNEARIKTAEKKYKEALQIHKKALDFAVKNKVGIEQEMFQENEIALLYVTTKDYDKALEWGELCKDRALKQKNNALLINAYKVLSETYKGLNDKANHEKYYTLCKYVEDSLYNKTDFNAAKHKLSQYEDIMVDSSMKSMKKKYTIITVILIIILTFFLIRYYKIRHKNKKLKAETEENRVETVADEKSETQVESIPLDDAQIEILYHKIAEVMGNNEKIFNPDFNLIMLSEEVQSNTKYVSWVINNKYNKNFKALLNEYRVNEACKMLDNEEICKSYTIQTIYKHIGYKNATSFIRVFKKNTGLNPLEYKNRNKDKEEQK